MMQPQSYSIPTPQVSAAEDFDSQVIKVTQGKPDPISLTVLLTEREKRIKSRLDKRVEELGNLPGDIPFDVKRKAIIETKMINLLALQKKVRAEIAMKMRKTIELETSSDLSAYRRARKMAIARDAARPSLAPLPQELVVARVDHETLKKQKHQEFLAAVIKHSRDFKDYHMMKQKKHKKMTKDVVTWHTNKQRQQQLEEERNQRARLAALKNDNETEYRKYLDEAKNQRLLYLLSQTDEYMDKICSMLKIQRDRDDIEEMKEAKERLKGKKGKKKGEEGPENAPKEDTTAASKPEAKNDNTVETNKKYYTMAHSIQETVTEQPEMIVGGKLKSYQLTGLQWLVSLYNNKLNGILADEMGLGKTIQTISLIAYLMEKKNDNGPYMIVVPLSTLSNWAIEFHKWAPTVNVVIYKGKPQTRKQIYKEEVVGAKFNVLLTSYEYVMLDKSDLGKLEWNYIIVDEGHRIKNRNSKLSNVLRQYMSRHRVLLTGTPLQNDLGELWSLLNFLLPHIFNSSDNFEQWFNAPFSYMQKKGKPETQIQPNEEEQLLIINRLHKVLRPFLLRRLKHDVESELPEKQEIVLKCDLSALQRRMYKNMVERGVLLNDPSNPNGKPSRKGFNNTLMQLQKICNHPYLFRELYNIDDDIVRASGKFDLIDRILPKLRKSGHRILIFNQMTHVMSIMEEYFEYRGYKYLRLDGSTKSEERTRLVNVWNAPDSPHWLFILSTKAGGLGLNLQTADTVIIFDTDWNPQADLQAQDRAHRIGQRKEVRVFRLVSQNSVEERILERATFKLDVDAKVIQAGMFNTQSNEKMRQAMLESLLHDDVDDREIEFVTSDEQINTLIARNDEEYQLFQQMDEEREKQLQEEQAKNPNFVKKPRLVTEDELPDYLKVDLDKLDEDMTEQYGRGRRKTTEVRYSDLTEAEFNKLLEGEENSSGRKRKKNGEGEEESPDGKRKKEFASEDLVQKYTAIWNRVASEMSADGTHQLANAFMKLPSKRDYGHYYKVIKAPISLKMIYDRLVNYVHPEYLKEDFARMIANAKTYNQEGSPIFQDALILEKLFETEYNNYFANYVAPAPTPANNNNNAAPASSTPAPPNTINPTTIRFSMSSINQAKSDRYNMDLRFDDEDDVDVDSSDYSDEDD